MDRTGRRILWVDDEIELLRPHLLILEQRGYQVDAVSNGDDAVALLSSRSYDLLLLDEHMPGRRGLDVLEFLRRDDPHARVVMVTKSEDDGTMTQAIGRGVEDYIVKPTSPRQVLSTVTRVLEGAEIHQRQVAQDFAARFGELGLLRSEAETAADYASLYSELVEWHLRLSSAGESGLLDSVASLLAEVRRDFAPWLREEYPRWVRGQGDRPVLSVDVVNTHLVPLLGEKPVLFVLLDCMRLDQWRVLAPLLAGSFDVEESLHYSILPTATPFSRNGIFSGLFPDEIARDHPQWWGNLNDEGSLNAYEDRLLREQLRNRAGRQVPVHYEKVFSDRNGEELRGRVHSAFKREGVVVALVFNFMDLLIHTRSESEVFMEVARDEVSLRDLTRAWFERSTVKALLEDAAREGVPAVVATDHGSIHCRRPTTVYARKDATQNLRYKFGRNITAEDPSTLFSTSDPKDLRLPSQGSGVNYVLATEDYYMVYPTKLREYQSRYRGAFLHGGVAPEEVIVPVAVLTPRSS